MNIMVYDIAAEKGGAVSILEYYYALHKSDKANRYYYLLSTVHLEDCDNITVINVPHIKKSWRKRIAFDLFEAPGYIRKYRIDRILSLQNTIVPGFRGEQTVYEHNALPFCEYRFSIRQDKKMWIYQNLIGACILWSVRKADHVIVQTEWMKDAIVRKAPGAEGKIEVAFPAVDIPGTYRYQKQSFPVFFYPANAEIFKNHGVIVDACEILKKENITDYAVTFTLEGNENAAVAALKRRCEAAGLNVRWVGSLPRTGVFDYYEKTILIFPSYIETIGLPIYEARQVGCPMLLADCAYARNLAAESEDVRFFRYDDARRLAALMARMITGHSGHSDPTMEQKQQ